MTPVPGVADRAETLSRDPGEAPPPQDLSKAEASERIEALQERTDRA